MPVYKDPITGKLRFSAIAAILQIAFLLAGAGATWYGVRFTVDQHTKELAQVKLDVKDVSSRFINHEMAYSGDKQLMCDLKAAVEKVDNKLDAIYNLGKMTKDIGEATRRSQQQRGY